MKGWWTDTLFQSSQSTGARPDPNAFHSPDSGR